ncbi:MAG: DUF423 domain-containing protein [Crocinitomicaceae bacterium]
MNKQIAIVSVLLIALGIILGAFGAHGLKQVVSPEKVASFEVGVRYQIYHGIALLILSLNASKIEGSLKVFLAFILGGILFFSGSIYLLALNDLIGPDLSFLGPLTPVGGVLMIAGWGVLVRQLLKMK